MNLLFPKFPWRLVPRMLAMALVGALISGVYGIIHDQITFSISREYFTHLKFDQFRAADFGFPERVFVAEIGFLGTWWVGFFAGWFLARIAVPVWPAKIAWRKVAGGFVAVFGIALVAGTVGLAMGTFQKEISPLWINMAGQLGVADVRSFMRVGYIHNAGYVGGVLGLVISVVTLWRAKRPDGTVDF